MKPTRIAQGATHLLLQVSLCCTVSSCHLVFPYSSGKQQELDAESKPELGIADSAPLIADSAPTIADSAQGCPDLPNGTQCGSGMVCYLSSCQAGCWISSRFYAPSTTRPDNLCQTCEPSSSISQWGNTAAVHTPCGEGGLQCGDGACLRNPVTFEYKGLTQTFKVPAGVTTLTVEAWGASGSGSLGGKGGYVKATLPISPGAVLQINVGGQGNVVNVVDNSPQPANAGGWNGGGSGGGTDVSCTVYGAGGASDVRTGAYGLADRILVAGGGGGQGSSSEGTIYSARCGTPGSGGAGGLVGGNGGAGSGTSFANVQGTPGGGATSSTGGTAGLAGRYLNGATFYDGYPGSAGSFGQGADGTAAWYCGGGGGGGGYYGGGSGGAPSANGGGGGSSWVTDAATGVTYTTGVQTGHGKIVLVW